MSGGPSVAILCYCWYYQLVILFFLTTAQPQASLFSQAVDDKGPFLIPYRNLLPRFPLTGPTVVMRVGFVKGSFYYCYFVVERLPILFFPLMQKLRKGGKQNIWIIIQAIRLHKRFHSPLHQVLTVKTAISVFAVIKHPEQSICVCVFVCVIK